MERIETATDNKVLVLRRDRLEILLGCRIDSSGFRIVQNVTDSEPMEQLERVTCRKVESRVLLLKIQQILQAETLRQIAGAHAVQLSCLVVTEAGVIDRESKRLRPIEKIRFGEAEVVDRLTCAAL